MKKKLLLVGLLGILSTGAFAMSGEFGASIENYNYNTGSDGYEGENSWIPTTTLKLKPINGSSFYVGGAFSKRARTHTDKRITDQRERTDAYFGQDFKFGNLTIKPKFQFRNEHFARQSDGTSKDMKEFRFYLLNGSYKINDKAGVFLSSYSALRRQDDDERTGETRPITKTYNDYHHEYELGMTYKYSPKNTLTLSVWNEIIHQKSIKTSSETQIRVANKYKVNDKISLTPYFRIGLQKADYYTAADSETGAVDVGTRHRLGLKGDYQVSPTFKLYAEVYVQPRTKNREKMSSGVIVDDKKNHTQVEQYVKVGFTQKF